MTFEVFRDIVEREAFGVVFTAHPTFSISQRLTRILAELASRENGASAKPADGPDDLSCKSLADLIGEAATTPHGSPETMTLDDEMDFALMAIGNIHRALRRVYRVLFAVTRRTYPDDWQTLKPKLLTVASWVGYDLDGRADIGWSVTLKKRMIVEKLAFDGYLDALAGASGLDDVQDRLRASAAMLDGDLERLDADPDDAAAVAAFSRALVESLETRLIDLGWVIGRLGEEIGKAITKDQERFNEMLQKSDRLRRFVSMAAYARHLSDLDRLHGYISLFDPTIWIRRSTLESAPERHQQMQHIAHILRHSSRHEKMNRVYRIFLNDTVFLDQALADMNAGSLLPEYAGACLTDLALLHGVRIALIHEIFLLIARMPQFSNLVRSADDVTNELLHLNIKHGVDILRQGFPMAEAASDPDAFGEAATYRTDADQGYEREHRELFDPIENMHDIVRHIGTAISHITGGVG